MQVVDEKLVMNWGLSSPSCIILGTKFSGNYKLTSKLGVHNMQQALCKAEPGDYKHAVNDM